MLELENFRKSYGDHLVLDIPLLQIPEGVSWFEGHNGSGKSSLFQSICGLEPFEGTARFIDGVTYPALDYKKRVRYTFAEPIYPPFLSGLELLRYFGKIYNAQEKEIQEWVEKFGVGEFYKKAIDTYSSGMLKKISLICGFLGEKTFLALDEPFTTIDTATQNLVLEELKNACFTTIIASHHPWDIQKLPFTAHFKVENTSVHAVL